MFTDGLAEIVVKQPLTLALPTGSFGRSAARLFLPGCVTQKIAGELSRPGGNGSLTFGDASSGKAAIGFRDPEPNTSFLVRSLYLDTSTQTVAESVETHLGCSSALLGRALHPFSKPQCNRHVGHSPVGEARSS